MSNSADDQFEPELAVEMRTDANVTLSAVYRQLPVDPPPSRGERHRDAVLRALDHPFFQGLGMIVMFLVVADGAFFFFLLMGWQSLCRPRTDCQPRNDLYNISVQLLNVLFTYMALVSMPWRCTNFLHMTGWGCPSRERAPGHDLYGVPTPEIWFHIPLRPRIGITIFLLLNCLTQFANQGTRIYYYNYERQNTPPGNIWVNVFFGTSFICAGIGGAWMLHASAKLRKLYPTQFGPGPMDMIKSMMAKSLHRAKGGEDGKVDPASSSTGVAPLTEEPAGTENLTSPARTEVNGTYPVSTMEAAGVSPSASSGSPSPPDPTRDRRRRSLLTKADRSSMRMWAM